MGVFGSASALLPGRTGLQSSLRRLWRVEWLLSLVPLWLGITAWIRPLSLPDEGRYVGVAWEMLRSGDWLVPTLDGLPFFHKPPLFYWLSAASMQMFGASAWAARVPSFLAAAAAALGLFTFLRRWSGPRPALASLLVLVTCPGWFGGAQFANHDMLVAGFISGSILLVAHAVLSRERAQPYRAALMAGFACAALGVLTKGLIGVVLPFLVISVWAVVSGRRQAVALLFRPAGVLLFAAIVLPWFVSMQLRFSEFFNYAFLHQQLDRFATHGFNNVRPWWFYVPVIVALVLPWSAAIIPKWRLGAASSQPSPERSLRALWWIWLAVVVIFFSVPDSKLVGYALPALPPVAALLGDWWRHARFDPGSALARLAGAAAVVCVAGTITMAVSDHKSARDLAAALKGQIDADDRIMMLDRYLYDAPFYLRSHTDPIVVASWHDAAVVGGDGWQKELADAASFAAPWERKRLVEPTDALAELCGSARRAWIFADASAAARYPWLSYSRRVYTSERLSAWEFEPGAAAKVCPDVPAPAARVPSAG